MITLSAMLFIWGIISIYRINKIAKKNKDFFNPYEGTIMDAIGFYFGITITVIWLFIIFITYLP